MLISFLTCTNNLKTGLKILRHLSQFHLFSIPLAVDIDKVSEDMKMELVELQSDTVLKQNYMDIGVPEFYKFLSRDKFPKLLSESTKIMTMFGSTYMTMFGSTYICQQFFSSMKINKTVLRSKLTDDHLAATLRLVSSQDIKTNIDVLVEAKRCQLSGQKMDLN